ncbi:MAG: hypothetical protein QF886_08415 [Planctomycetota bacterium]|jgi:hypothetical protein|nr:hypothetical protein [Planctomycetota bacterium]
MNLKKTTPLPRDVSDWQAIACHSHHMRGGDLDLDGTNRNLIRWCRKHNIRAAGVGSPWEPVSASHYGQYEGADRDLYYSGQFDPRSVMDEKHIAELFAELNELSQGEVLLYHDNETPKGRNGHCWWIGYHYDFPAWHDYSQDRPIQYHDNDPECELNSLTGKPHRRRCHLEVFAAQRRRGAIGVWAHPTSWWLAGETFITNIASDCGLSLLADGCLDGMVCMGYRAFKPSYQELWFYFLDQGAIVPCFAENDCAHSNSALLDNEVAYKNYMHLPGTVSVETITETARRGRTFCSTGAFATLSIDGIPMGGICPTSKDKVHRLTVHAWPEEGESCFSRLDIIGRGGVILDSVHQFPGGKLEFDLPGSAGPSYIVVRGFGEKDDPNDADYRRVIRMVLTNPVYLHPSGFRFAPASTDYILNIHPRSPWIGGSLIFECADGAEIESFKIRPGEISRHLPASARVRLVKEQEERMFYIAMENDDVQALLRYLWRGEFRRDYPETIGGEVPYQAWRLDDMRRALSRCRYEI